MILCSASKCISLYLLNLVSKVNYVLSGFIHILRNLTLNYWDHHNFHALCSIATSGPMVGCAHLWQQKLLGHGWFRMTRMTTTMVTTGDAIQFKKSQQELRIYDDGRTHMLSTFSLFLSQSHCYIVICVYIYINILLRIHIYQFDSVWGVGWNHQLEKWLPNWSGMFP